jgi:hypothetical protein
MTRPSFAGMTYSNCDNIQFSASSGANLINLTTTTLCPILLNAGGGADAIFVNETFANASVTIARSSGDDSVSINPGGVGSASAIFNATQRIGQLTIAAGGLATIATGANKVLTTTGIAITGTGALNINDNDVIVDYSGSSSPVDAIGAQVASGYNFGAWNGAGIRSATAAPTGGLTGVGVAEASAVTGLSGTATALWNGQTIDGTCVLLKYTYMGDGNLDGTIDGADYGIIDNTVQVAGAHGYFNGDFNYDGVIDGADYGVIDNNIQAQGAPL